MLPTETNRIGFENGYVFTYELKSPVQSFEVSKPVYMHKSMEIFTSCVKMYLFSNHVKFSVYYKIYV